MIVLWLVDQGSPSLPSPNPSPSNYNAVDTASAVAIALMTFGTMYPMSVYSGKVLLQVRTSQPSRVRLFPRYSHLFVLTDHTPSRHWSAGQTAQRGETFRHGAHRPDQSTDTPEPICDQWLCCIPDQVSTLDGVLEVRNEHFWTVGFGSLVGGGSQQVLGQGSTPVLLL